MKAILLASILLSAAPVFAQNATQPIEAAPGSIAALDAKNGFRTYKFGTPIADIPNFQKKGKDSYVAKNEQLNVGDAKLFALLFGSYHDKLASVVFGAMGEDNCQKLLQALMIQYGTGKQVSADKMIWVGEVVTMTFEMKSEYSTYISRYSTPKPTKSCTVIIASNAANAEQAAENKAAAQKAASDL